MEAVAHSPAFAKKAGIPQSVGKDFSSADKGRKFSKGGETMATKSKTSKVGGKSLDAGNPKKMVKVQVRPGTIDGVAMRGRTKGKQLGIDGPKMPSKTKR
jgi:hypothetical protein